MSLAKARYMIEWRPGFFYNPLSLNNVGSGKLYTKVAAWRVISSFGSANWPQAALRLVPLSDLVILPGSPDLIKQCSLSGCKSISHHRRSWPLDDTRILIFDFCLKHQALLFE